MLVVLELELFSSSESDSTVLTDNFLFCCSLLFLYLLTPAVVFAVSLYFDVDTGESPAPESGDEDHLDVDAAAADESLTELLLLVMMTLLSLLIIITVVILIL